MNKPERKETAQRALVWVGIALAVVVLLVLLWYGLDVVLLAFLGVLLAILLRAPAEWLSRRTGLGIGWTLSFVGASIVAALAVGGYFFGRARGAGGRPELPHSGDHRERKRASPAATCSFSARGSD